MIFRPLNRNSRSSSKKWNNRVDYVCWPVCRLAVYFARRKFFCPASSIALLLPALIAEDCPLPSSAEQPRPSPNENKFWDNGNRGTLLPSW
jgi:hypothetical protein